MAVIVSQCNINEQWSLKKNINAYTPTHTCQNKDSTHAWSNDLVRSIASSKSFGINVTESNKKHDKAGSDKLHS